MKHSFLSLSLSLLGFAHRELDDVHPELNEASKHQIITADRNRSIERNLL